jgi:hypothetical protein
MRSVTALLIVLGIALLSVAAPVYAQQQATPADQAPTVDVDRLPLNLNRIQRQLRHAADLEQRDGLNLRYVIQIYGTAPPLQLFTDESNLVNGPVPYGAPTHRELIDHVTPQQFRAPVADFSALMRWLADRDKDKEKRKR